MQNPNSICDQLLHPILNRYAANGHMDKADKVLSELKLRVGDLPEELQLETEDSQVQNMTIEDVAS